MAAVTAGVPIVTRDFDICYRHTRENCERLAAALKSFQPTLRGAPPDLPFRFDGATLMQGSNFTFTTSAGDLDVLGHVSGLGGYDDIAPRAVRYTVYDHELLVMSLEDLLKAKRAAGRAKDLGQIVEIERTLQLRNRQP
jgi:hypothetical protein